MYLKSGCKCHKKRIILHKVVLSCTLLLTNACYYACNLHAEESERKVMASTRFYLDRRKAREGQPAVLKLAIAHRHQTVLISLDVRLLPSQLEYDELSNKYRSLESSSSMRIERLEQEKNDLLARIKAMLDLLHEKLREAVKVLIEYSRSVLREFSIRHRDTIVEYLAYSPDVRNAAQSIKIFARPFLDNRQFDKGRKELDRLTSNFPSVLEEVNRTQNRGFRL